jgi:hypothetical protein
MEIVKFIFSNFWIWLGFVIILSEIGTFIFRVYNRALRHRSIMKHGYPPEHCDADGDFPEVEDDDE